MCVHWLEAIFLHNNDIMTWKTIKRSTFLSRSSSYNVPPLTLHLSHAQKLAGIKQVSVNHQKCNHVQQGEWGGEQRFVLAVILYFLFSHFQQWYFYDTRCSSKVSRLLYRGLYLFQIHLHYGQMCSDGALKHIKSSHTEDFAYSMCINISWVQDEA